MTNRVAELRTLQGWSQAQLAELLSITRQTVIAIEQSKTDPSLSTAMRVSWLFRKPVESIFLADIDEQLIALKETWDYKTKTAQAQRDAAKKEAEAEASRAGAAAAEKREQAHQN